jgi:HEPN domain-containing protein
MREAAEVREWLKKAEDDYAGALHLSRRRKKPLPDLVCFHCQQAAEKFLKAFLISQETPFAKTHDLLALLELCTKHQPEFELHSEWFEVLNPYSVQFRYPGEEATVEEARLAIKTIKQIAVFMRSLFPSELLSSAEM